MIGIAKKFGIGILTAALLAVSVSAAAAADKSKAAKEKKAESPIILNQHVVVKDNVIRLGDVFGNVGDKAHIPIAYAPAPGQRLTLDVNWLYRAASVFKLDWKPFSLQQQTVIERDSIVFRYEEIKERIHSALDRHGIDKNAEIDLGNRMFRMHAPNETGADLTVEDITIDKRDGRFTAILAVLAGKPGEIRRHVSGWIRNMTAVPVLAKRLGANEVIRKNDIKWIQVRTDRVQQDLITKLDDVVGKAPKRTLIAGEPIRLSDIQEPVLVAKGSLVTMELNSKFMRLTARGRALENGGKGDVIRVTNSKSRKQVEAKVIGHGRVSIDPHGHLAMKSQ